MRRAYRFAILAGILGLAPGPSRGEGPGVALRLDEATRGRCLAVLRGGLGSPEFWPGIHAAEALALAGCGDEVRAAITPRLNVETDDQRRCGLAREVVRAGDLASTRILLDVLAKADSYGHTHSCESLFKVGQIGDGTLLRRAQAGAGGPGLKVMAAAALARWGNPKSLNSIREAVNAKDGETARVAAWVLARTGSRGDIAALRAGAGRFDDPLTRAYFEHAAAALGDPAGRAALARNLRSDDPRVRVYAAEFAPDARAVEAQAALVRLLDDPVLDVRVRAADALLRLAMPTPPPPGEDVARDVFPATERNPRYSEGSVLVLRDGRLLYATTEFEGSWSDFAKARIIAAESADEGRTWGAPRVLQENVGKLNVMSVTLRRLSHGAVFDGPIGMFYLLKNSPADLQVFLRVSDDEGATFGPPVRVTAGPGYHVLNNDRVTVLSSGRLVVPVASTGDVDKENRFACACYLSDDRGKTWRRGRGSVAYPRRGAMEPEVLEQEGGRLLMHVRTQLGHIAVSESGDGGETWGPARPWGVPTPESPATLRRVPSTGDLLLIWDDSFRQGDKRSRRRTPLTAAVSTDEGRTWSYRRDLETDDEKDYAYTSVVFHRGRALLTYYVHDRAAGRISSRFRSVPVAWFYGRPAPGGLGGR
jgi:sialidase-1